MSTATPTTSPRRVRVLSYAEARVILDAALAKASDISVPASVAVLDAGRELLAFGRQDDAPLLTGEVATAKAYTSVSLRQPSANLAEPAGAGGAFADLHHSTRRPMATFGGGLPLFDGTDLVGSVGASGGSVDEDLEIANAALAAFEGLPR